MAAGFRGGRGHGPRARSWPLALICHGARRVHRHMVRRQPAGGDPDRPARRYRGRVMSLWTVVGFGTVAIGAGLIGGLGGGSWIIGPRAGGRRLSGRWPAWRLWRSFGGAEPAEFHPISEAEWTCAREDRDMSQTRETILEALSRPDAARWRRRGIPRHGAGAAVQGGQGVNFILEAESPEMAQRMEPVRLACEQLVQEAAGRGTGDGRADRAWSGREGAADSPPLQAARQGGRRTCRSAGT
jgi:hypothetical protein